MFVASLAVAAVAIALHYGRSTATPSLAPPLPRSSPSSPPPTRADAPSESELRRAVSPQELFTAWQKCYDVPAYAARCPQLAGLCTEAGGTTVRRICSRTCGTCLATTDGLLHAQESELLRALEALDGAAEGAEPRVSVLQLGAEQARVRVRVRVRVRARARARARVNLTLALT